MVCLSCLRVELLQLRVVREADPHIPVLATEHLHSLAQLKLKKKRGGIASIENRSKYYKKRSSSEQTQALDILKANQTLFREKEPMFLRQNYDVLSILP